MSARKRSSETRIEFRASKSLRDALHQAAAATEKSVSEFARDAVVRATQETLADRRRFVLDETKWKAFLKALQAPASSKPRLDRLMKEKSVFE